MKKILSLVLALTLVFSIGSASIAEDKVTLKVVVPAGVQSFMAGEDENNNYIIRQIEEALGMELEWNILPADNSQAKLNAMMASADEAPDVIYNGSRDLFLQYVTDEMIISLDEYVTEETFRYCDYKAMGVLDGHYYAIPFTGSQADNNSIWWYNKALLADAGIEAPEKEMTLDEFTDLLYKIKEVYPDKYVIGANGSGSGSFLAGLDLIYGAFGVANSYRVSEDGKLEYALSTDDMKDCLIYLNQLYADSILDPEYVVTTQQTLNEKILSSNVVSVFAGWSQYNNMYETSMNNGGGAGSNHGWGYVNMIDGGRITKGVTEGSGIVAGYGMVSYTCEYPEEAVKLLEYVSSSDYVNLIFYGIEGEDWERDGEGNIVRIQTGTITQAYAPGGTSFYVYYFNHENKDQRIARVMTTKANYDREYKMDCWYECKLVPNPILDMPMIPEYVESQTDIEDVAATYIIKFVMGDKSFDEWDSYLDEIKAVGGDDVLAALQAWYENK